MIIHHPSIHRLSLVHRLRFAAETHFCLGWIFDYFNAQRIGLPLFDRRYYFCAAFVGFNSLQNNVVSTAIIPSLIWVGEEC